MRKLFINKKAVSPVIATILMILIVMAGMTILFAFIGVYAQSFQAGSGSAVLESIAIEDVWFKSDIGDHYLYIWVYNTGKVDFTIDSIYVNSAPVTPTLYDSNHNPIEQTTPITIGSHIQIKVTSWAAGSTYIVKIVTSRGSGFEGTYSPS
jgi:flagellin-like protein